MSGIPSAYHDLASAIDAALARHGVRLTIGGEPTFLPEDPVGEEWMHAAVGPGKLAAARAMADHLLAESLPGAAAFFSPGKLYPGEQDPRWSIWLVARRDGRAVFPTTARGQCTSAALATLRAHVCRRLGLADTWRSFVDPVPGATEVWALLLDADPTATEPHWETWPWPEQARGLVAAAGPAGLRLPLTLLEGDIPRRSLSLEWRDDRLAIFLPPVLQPGFLHLLNTLCEAAECAGLADIDLQGSLPPDEADLWIRLGLAADPGVLEVNLPACEGWAEYDRWIRAVSQAADAAGLRPWRRAADGRRGETGGGNHLLWGSPTQTDHPFFTRPGWLAGILRYWQRHPSLSYCFTGDYLGPCSQAPRADESGQELHDLDWTWAYLATLPPGDRRQEIADAIRHLQADHSGNTHRTEISFDKFWFPDFPGGGQGLVEFRAIAMMPEVEWASSVALLWSALAAWLLERPYAEPLVDHGRRLQDRFFLPSVLWRDLEQVLADLDSGGFPLPSDMYRAIWGWRFPLVLEFAADAASLAIRRAGEHWPILVDPPKSGGMTSRFVDSSLRRLEFLANESFASEWTLAVNGRPLPLAAPSELPGQRIAGLRYRHSRLYPCLHPGLAPQLPLRLSLHGPGQRHDFELRDQASGFVAVPATERTPGASCCPIHPGDITHDLRVNSPGDRLPARPTSDSRSFDR
jgi:uncharacterized protein (DUF2126 family)